MTLSTSKYLAETASLAAIVNARCKAAGQYLSDDTRADAHHLEHRLRAAADTFCAGDVRAITADILPATGEMLEMMEEAMSEHIYDARNGEKPAADCRYLASIERVRAALGLIPSGIETEAPELVTPVEIAGELAEVLESILQANCDIDDPAFAEAMRKGGALLARTGVVVEAR